MARRLRRATASLTIRSCNVSVCSSRPAKKRKRSTRNFCSPSSTACHPPAALAWASIGSPCCSPVRSRSATSSCFHCSDQRNNLGLASIARRYRKGGSAIRRAMLIVTRLQCVIFGTEPRALNPPATSTYRSISKVTIDPVSNDFLVFHCGSEFFDVDRADVSQRFGSFADDTLHGVFPTLRRFGSVPSGFSMDQRRIRFHQLQRFNTLTSKPSH